MIESFEYAIKFQNVMKSIIPVIILVFLCGCSSLSREMTPEEKEQHLSDVYVIKETVVKPVYLLIRESCRYNMSNGHWPERNENITSSGSFDHLKIISSDSREYKLNLKIESVEGSADISVFKYENDKFEKPYGFSLVARFPGGLGMKVKSHFSCSKKGFTDAELLDYSSDVASRLKSYKVYSDMELRKKESSVTEKTFELGAQIAICMLLKLESSSCK